MPIDPTVHSRARASDELLQVALTQFATAGFTATSLQQIADEAGYSKSSVLYHYASKEALLEAAITPTIERLEVLVGEFAESRRSEAARGAFIERFVDLLLGERLAVHLFVSQGYSLGGIPIVERGNAAIRVLADAICADASLVEQMRFGVALAGATYVLVAGATFFDEETMAELTNTHSDDEMREALVEVVSELLLPADGRQTR